MTKPEDSSPLVPRGFGAPKFPENAQDKFLANEDENAYVQLEVFGDPAPTISWFKGEVDLLQLDRFKGWTDGSKGYAFLGVENAQKDDEGIYRCVAQNRFGKREHKFKLFIARSWQLKKGPPKREVPIYWSEVPRSKFTKEKLLDRISFTAKLTVEDKTAHWTFNNQRLESGDKYEVSKAGGNFTVVINDPVHSDTGCYRCCLNEVDLSCETYLDVQLPDPEYSFLRPLSETCSTYTGKCVKLMCITSRDAEIEWTRDLKALPQDDHITITASEGEHELCISSPNLNDSGYYQCRILKFGKPDCESTGCQLSVEEYPHKLTKKLPNQLDLIERQDLILQVHSEEDFCTVNWYKDNVQLHTERKRHQRLFISSSDCMHQLKIEKVKPSDTGVYTAKTNRDQSCTTVHVTEYPYLFASSLPAETSVLEGNRVLLEVTTQDEEADVEWWLNDEKLRTERSRTARIQATSSGCTRTLAIKKTCPTDSGVLSARTNKAATETTLRVKCVNEFLERLVDTVSAAEHTQVEFSVKMKDVFAPVQFFLDRMRVEEEEGRVEILNPKPGLHCLRFNKVKMTDAGLLCAKSPSNRGSELLQCIATFNVTEGESAPTLGPAEPVSCVAILQCYSDRMNSYIQKEQCRILVPYKIEGSRVSTVDILVEKDGRELEIGNEIQMRVKTDKIQIDVINPQRSNSGLYKVTMSNEQGSAELDIPVTVLDIPSAPRSCHVTDIFKDSVLVSWESPVDNGGCPIKHYIVEALNISTSQLWHTVAMSETGEEFTTPVGNLLDGHKYMFRVSAANRVGQSEPVEYRGTILTKDPWEVPAVCGRSTVIDWTPTFADIVWAKPVSDGGTPIIKYIIQIKEKSSREWWDGWEIPVDEVEIEGDQLRGRCENLEEEFEYAFRVLSVNRAGRGLPGPPSLPVIAMYKNIPPSLKGDGLTDFKIKEGRPIRFDVWIAGEPAPTIEWMRNEEKIVADDLTNISLYSKNASCYTLKNAVLSIPKALEEYHKGVYKLRLKNESGVFESIARVDIEGPPGRPKKVEEKVEQVKEEEEVVEEDLPLPFINRKLSEIKSDTKDEDKDSGLKIGEESLPDTEESEWTEYSEDEDFYEEQEMKEEDEAIEESRKICETNNVKNLSNSTIQSRGELNDNNASPIDSEHNIPEIMDNTMSVEGGEENFSNLKSTDNHIIQNDNSSNHFTYESNNAYDENGEQSAENISTEKFINNAEAGEIPRPQNEANGIIVEIDPDTSGPQLQQPMNKNQHENIPSVTSQVMLSGVNDTVTEEMKESSTSSSAADNNTRCGFQNTQHSADRITEEKSATKTLNSSDESYETQDKQDVSQNDNKNCTTSKNTTSKTGVHNMDANMQAEQNKNKSWNDSQATEDDIENGNYNSQSRTTIHNDYEKYYDNDQFVSENENNNFSEKEISHQNGHSNEMSSCDDNTENNAAFECKQVDQTTEYKEPEPTLGQQIQLAAETERKRREEAEREEEQRLLAIKHQQEKERAKKELKRKESVMSMQSCLDKRLQHLGFTRNTKSDIQPESGDGCLMSLLDQMNREDQDFKVWERDDYSFLRWYVTKQMESHVTKGTQAPFLGLINGDPTEYIEKISEDGVHLDEVFLNACAIIFNKDIIIIPASDSEDVRVLYGGLGNTKGKGAPLFLGTIEPTPPEQASDEATHAPIFFSIHPDESSQAKFVYGELNGDVNDRKVSVLPAQTTSQMDDKPSKKRSWKRMDSYTGSASKDLDSIINEIAGDNMEEMFKKLDQCEDDNDDEKDIVLDEVTENKNIVTNNVDSEQDMLNKLDQFEDDNGYDNEGNVCDEGTENKYTNSVSDNVDSEQDVLNKLDQCEDDDGYDYEDNVCDEDIEQRYTNNVSDNVEQVDMTCAQTENTGDLEDISIQGKPSLVDTHLQSDNNDVLRSKIEIPVSSSDNISADSEIEWHSEVEPVKCDLTSTAAENKETNTVDKVPHRVRKIKITASEVSPASSPSTNSPDEQEEFSFSEASTLSQPSGSEPVLDATYLPSTLDSEAYSDGTYLQTNGVTEPASDATYLQTSAYSQNLLDATYLQIATDPDNTYLQCSDTSLGGSTLSEDSLKDIDQIDNAEHSPSSSMSQGLTCETNNNANISSGNVYANSDLQNGSHLTKSTSQNFENRLSISNSRESINETTPSVSNVKSNGIADINIMDMPFGSADRKSGAGNTKLVIDSEGNPAEVPMRQRKYSRRRSTASYRWSGVEMCQVDGPPACTDNDDTENRLSEKRRSTEQAEPPPDIHRKRKSFMSTISTLGLKVTERGEGRSDDTCLASLLDQMSRCGDDYKVWDKDDHSFLKWYINKQMQIQISAGNGAGYLGLDDSNNSAVADHFLDQNNPPANEYFLRAFSRIFNRDVVIVTEGNPRPEAIVSKKAAAGKRAAPLILGKIQDADLGYQVFSSLVPNGDQELNSVVENLLKSTA